MYTTDVCMAQVTGCIHEAVSHEELSVQNPSGGSTGLPGVEWGRQQAPAAWTVPALLLLAQEDRSQVPSLLSLVRCHPFTSCSEHLE